MIAVNGMSGSGFEAALSSFGRTAGSKYVAPAVLKNYSRSVELASSDIAAYEAYLGKYDAGFAVQEMLKDMQAILPDGTWPVTEVPYDYLESTLGLDLSGIGACRLGTTLLEARSEAVDAVIIVLASPEVVKLRRAALRYATRKLDAKYMDYRLYGLATSAEFRDWYSIVPVAMSHDLVNLRRYVCDCLAVFGSKVQFVSGDTATLSFTVGDRTVTVPNRQAFEDLIAAAKPGFPPDPAGDYEKPADVYADILAMAAGTVKPLRTPLNVNLQSWYCSRLRDRTGDRQCMECIKSLGETALPQARPGWDKEPCAYEVAYGPGKHKTIEQSIKEHNWRVLP